MTSAIIIAAGRGKRMGHLTEDKPKCLLEFDGKALIQIQIDHLRSSGIKNISVIKGYQQEKISIPDVKYYFNENYQDNNILESLFCAEEELQNEVIVLYADIIFEKKVVEELLNSPHEISLIVDTNWRENYVDRHDHPIEEAENVVFDEHFQVQRIGKILGQDKTHVPGEFIGMMKLSGNGAWTLKNFYHSSKRKYGEGAFQTAKTFRQAYLTDIHQEMVDHGVTVTCVPIQNGWKEIDTIEDFNQAKSLYPSMWG